MKLVHLRKLHARLAAGLARFRKKHPVASKGTRLVSLVIAGYIVLSIGLGAWWSWLQRSRHIDYGTSFSIKQAQNLGINPRDAFSALLHDLNLRRFRLMSYWDMHEPKQGEYDFSELDWQFREAEKVHATITLAIGVRQPRWPECHDPQWAKDLPKDQWRVSLNSYIKAVVNRYKNSPALESYQLENEFFIAAFGTCTDFDRSRLVSEYNLVKQTDPNHTVIISLSNIFGVPIGEPWPDEFGASIYKRVYSTRYIHDYVEYPVPAWYYAVRAGWIKLVTGKNLVAHEFQMEPWGPEATQNLSIEEQNKSMDVVRMHDRFRYARHTTLKTIDLWGSEWWYWRKVKFNDPGPWEAVRQELQHV